MKTLLIYSFIILILMFTETSHAQWLQTNGPNCGQVNCITGNKNKLFAGTSKGMYQSVDLGKNWSKVTEFGDGIIYKSASVDSSVFVVAQSKFFVSKNSGTSWESNPFNRSGVVSSIAFNDSCIFVGTSGGGVYKSIDKGVSWNTVNSGLTDLDIRCLHTKGNTVFASTWSAGTFWSKNNGRSWTSIDLDPSTSAKTYAYSFFNLDAGILAGTDREIYLSTDNGNTWSKTYSVSLGSPGFSNFAKTDIALFAASSGEILKSVNNGLSWTPVNNTLRVATPNLKNTNRMYVLENKIFVGNTGRGIYVSEDNGTIWKSANNGFRAGNILDIEFIGNKIFALQFFAGIYVSTDNGANWKEAHEGLAPDLMIFDLSVKENTLYAATLDGIRISNDYGTSWYSLNNGLIDLHIIKIVTNAGNVFALDYSGNIYTLSVTATNWVPVQMNTPINRPVNLVINDKFLFAITASDGVYMSADNGKNWISRNTGLTSKNISDIVFNGNSAFASSDVGIFKSTNNGENWVSASGGLKYLNFFDLAIGGNNIFAADNSGNVHLSTDNGANWNTFTWGLNNNIDVRKLAILGDYIFAGTDGHSVWKRPLSETSGTKTTINNAKIQVYPNPANKYIIIETEHVSEATISICNLEGKECLKTNKTGSNIQVDIHNIPNGVYILKVITSENTEIYRFIKN